MRRNMISGNTSFFKITSLWIKVTAASNSLLEICEFKHLSLRKTAFNSKNNNNNNIMNIPKLPQIGSLKDL